MDLSLAPPSAAIVAFAHEVGDSGPVAVVGGHTHWHVGGELDAGARLVRAPSGIVAHEPEELIVRCGAGTPVGELAMALADHGQMTPIDPVSPDATVGGVLSVGYSGLRRLRYGPVRDLLLEARYVAADGELVKAGAPVVKNVTGFDLCRLLVGSIGTLGFIGEVVLRCRPLPAASRWMHSYDADPFAIRRKLFGASSILWDGSTTWVLLEGYGADVDAETRLLGPAFAEVAGPPSLPIGTRKSMAPTALRDLSTGSALGSFIAEIGVGTVHSSNPTEGSVPSRTSGTVGLLNRDLKNAFDPTGRLNPGRCP